jgi:FkbM family methyltransferase
VPNLSTEPKTVLDLGSNIGLTMAHYRHLWPSCIIHGYEIDEENIYMSSVNAPYERVHHNAITNMKHAAYRPEGSPQAYKVNYHFVIIVGEKRVEGRTLDQAINAMNTDDGCVDFVKMDIEGEEYLTLENDGAWPERINNLLVECHGIDEDDTKSKTELIKKKLERKGFEVIKHEPHWSSLFAWRT